MEYGITSFDPNFLLNAYGIIEITTHNKTYNLTIDCEIIPDRQEIFNCGGKYQGFLILTNPDDGKSYLIHADGNENGIVTAWGNIPPIRNGVLTGTLIRIT